MKRIYLLFATLLTALALSCSKDDGGSNSPMANANNDPIKGVITLSVSIDQPQDVSFRNLWAADLEINWGDGNTTHEIAHHYSKRGNFKITIKGTGIYSISFCDGSSNITAIDVRKCPNLESINCGSSQITGIDLTNSPHLKILECSNSYKISTLDLSRCMKIETLYCPWGGIEHIIFGSSTSLKYLTCNDNKLTSLDLSKASQIMEVSCSNNQLKELLFCDNNNLKVLYCNNNQIATLHLKISATTTPLVAIYCKNNKIENLEIISERPTYIECSNNNIKNLDLRQCLIITRVLAGHNQLENLHIDGCRALDLIDCSYNSLDNAALNAIYNSLPIPSQNQWGSSFTIGIAGNNDTGDKSIAEAKGWKVVEF